MAKKDFSAVSSTIEQATGKYGQQATATKEERARRAAEGRTQGRKGCKAARINLAFTTENYEFIRVMSRASGRTMTEFCNLVLEAYRREHPEVMEQARVFLDMANSLSFSDKN